MIIIVLIISAIVMIFNPLLGAMIYIIIVAIYEAVKSVSGNITCFDVINNKKIHWTDMQKMYLKRHYIFFKFPASSPVSSRRLSGIAMLTFLVVPLLIFKGVWFLAIIIGLNYFIAQKISVKLNPVFYMMQKILKNMDTLHPSIGPICVDLIQIIQILDKLYETTGDSYYKTTHLKETKEYKLAVSVSPDHDLLNI